MATCEPLNTRFAVQLCNTMQQHVSCMCAEIYFIQKFHRIAFIHNTNWDCIKPNAGFCFAGWQLACRLFCFLYAWKHFRARLFFPLCVSLQFWLKTFRHCCCCYFRCYWTKNSCVWFFSLLWSASPPPSSSSCSSFSLFLCLYIVFEYFFVLPHRSLVYSLRPDIISRIDWHHRTSAHQKRKFCSSVALSLLFFCHFALLRFVRLVVTLNMYQWIYSTLFLSAELEIRIRPRATTFTLNIPNAQK